MQLDIQTCTILVYNLKSVGPLEFKLAAPMPEQVKTTAMHFYEVSRKPYMCLLTPQRNALLWSQHVLGWVQRNSNFGSLDHRLYSQSCYKQAHRSNIWGKFDPKSICVRTHHKGCFFLRCNKASKTAILCHERSLLYQMRTRLLSTLMPHSSAQKFKIQLRFCLCILRT